MGTALALGNCLAVIGIATLQYLMGWLIERHPAVTGVYPEEAYRDFFSLLFAGVDMSLILYSSTRENRGFLRGFIQEVTNSSHLGAQPIVHPPSTGIVAPVM